MKSREGVQVAQHINIRVAERAAAAPHRVAVEYGDVSLTYAELHIRGCWVASRLSQLGVSDDVLVGVLMEGSVDVATAMVGIIGARGAYLPLDVRTPIERLQFILKDSGVAALVVNRESAALASILNAEVPIIVVEETSPDIPEFATTTGGGPLDRLAYVIDTSGSTGEPKGAEVLSVLSRSVLHFLDCMQRELDFGPDDTMLALAPVSFDVATLEFLLPLFCGGRLIVLPCRTGAEGEALARAISNYDASVELATPTTWQLLLDAGWTGNPKLRAVSGGEILHASLARQLAPLVKSWNQRGPTETTIATATYRVRGGPCG